MCATLFSFLAHTLVFININDRQQLIKWKRPFNRDLRLRLRHQLAWENEKLTWILFVFVICPFVLIPARWSSLGAAFHRQETMKNKPRTEVERIVYFILTCIMWRACCFDDKISQNYATMISVIYIPGMLLINAEFQKQRARFKGLCRR